jgi:hypothetical protein
MTTPKNPAAVDKSRCTCDDYTDVPCQKHYPDERAAFIKQEWLRFAKGGERLDDTKKRPLEF